MKTKIIYISILLVSFLIFGCGDPAPTQLVEAGPTDNDNQNLIIESIPDDPSTIDYSNGYDSTGLPEPVLKYANVVNLCGIKNTIGNATQYKGFYSAEFKNLNDTILAGNGRLLGFRSMYYGRVFFGGDSAFALPRKVKYKIGERIVEVPAGFFHILSLYRPPEMKPFPYNSAVELRIEPLIGQAANHTIYTPPEITGNLLISGSRQSGNLKVRVTWNPSQAGTTEVILGGRIRGTDKYYPIFKIKAPDSGMLKIPKGLLESFPYYRFDKMMFTLIRKYEFRNQVNNLVSNYIVSQSIHNIIIDIP